MSLLTNEALHKKTPQELTALLYDVCATNLEQAVDFIEKKEWLDANQSIQKAIVILQRLGAGINYEAGIIADQLDSLYNYMADTLIAANYEKNKAKVEEVLQILINIMSAWNEAMKKNIDVQPRSQKLHTHAYEQTAIYDN